MQTLTLDRSDLERDALLVLAGLDRVQEQLQVVRAGARDLIDKYACEDACHDADLAAPGGRAVDVDRRLVG